MKKRYLIWLIAICVCLALVMGAGLALKYAVLRPLGIAQEKPAAAIPFLLFSDPGLRMQIEQARIPPTTQPTLPVPSETTVPTSPPTTAPADTTAPPATQPPTEPPATIPPTTQATAPSVATEPIDPTAATTEPLPPEPPVFPEMVDEGWYADVLFIGDSRTVELANYARREGADYFCSVGMTVFNFEDRWASDLHFKEQTLDMLLSAKQYGKIIISLGINECGYPHDNLILAYQSLIAFVRERQPDAVLFLQGILTVSREKAKSEEYFQPGNIFSLNSRIEALAQSETAYYIDPNPFFADAEGYLPDALSGDGCHIYAKYCPWLSDWVSYAVKQAGF